MKRSMIGSGRFGRSWGVTPMLLMVLAGGVGLPSVEAFGQRDARQRDQGGAERSRAVNQAGAERSRRDLEERDRASRLAEIESLKQTLVELRDNHETRGVPTIEQLEMFEQQLLTSMLDMELDPFNEMEEVGGFEIVDVVAAIRERGGVVPGEGLMAAEGDDVGLGALAGLDADEGVTLNFTAPVNLAEFARFVARALEINIFADPTLEGQVVEFMAPVEVPREDLLNLLGALVDERGFALVRDRLGFYTIRPVGDTVAGFGADLSTSRMISTPLVRPSRLAPLVESMFGSQVASVGETGTVRLTAFDDLGIMTISGPPRLLDRVEDAVERFVEKQLSQEFFTFALTNVSAEFARDRLLVLGGETSGQSVGRPVATRGANATRGAVSSSPGESLSNLDGRLTVGGGNTLIFRGEEAEAALVGTLLETIDTVSRLTPKRYTAGSVAEQVAIAASELGLGSVAYADQLGAGSSIGGTTRRTGTQRTGLFGDDGRSSELAGSRSVVDLENGTIVYYGTSAQQSMFEAIVEQFVADAVQDETVIQAYKLDNADAEGVAGLLQDLIEDPSRRVASSPLFPGQRGGRGGDRGPLPPVSEEGDGGGGDVVDIDVGGGVGLVVDPDETIILSDVDRNQIIIKAKPDAQRQFARLIQQLDERQPQVQLNVQIVSVTTSNNFDWGADLQANIGEFFSFSTFGVTDAPDQPFDVPGFNVGGSGIVAGIIDSESISLVIRALETVGDTRLASNPTIIVNDNQPALLNSVRTEPFATTSQGGDSTVTGQGGTESAGTVLNVTPQISSGGYITLEYNIELSSFDLANRQPGLSPPTQQEIYESVVTLPSDSTVVVGGFRQSSDSDNESKVPILGDLPLIGNAFKSRSVQRQQRTIFVFITPRILDNPQFSDLRLITEGPRTEAEVPSDIPPLDSVRIPIRSGGDRLIPRNLIADDAEARGGGR